MSDAEMRNLILSLSQDVVFEYDGTVCCINPWNSKKFEVGYGTFSKTYTNIFELMSDKIFGNKSLSDICKDINLI